MSSSASSSDYATDEELELEQPPPPPPPLSAGSLLLSHLDLPDHHNNNNQDSLDTQLSTMTANAKGKRTGCGHQETTDEVLKEIKNLKRQNVITHCLLGTMIFVTLGWQLSEVSLILTLKDGFTHPFRSIGSFLSKTLKKRSLTDQVDAAKEEISSISSSSLVPIEPHAMPGFKMPKLPEFLDISKWGQKSEC